MTVFIGNAVCCVHKQTFSCASSVHVQMDWRSFYSKPIAPLFTLHSCSLTAEKKVYRNFKCLIMMQWENHWRDRDSTVQVKCLWLQEVMPPKQLCKIWWTNVFFGLMPLKMKSSWVCQMSLLALHATNLSCGDIGLFFTFI